MSERWLGVPFDIHGGGLDLIFPHHENEIAQTCCAHGLERMANLWLHNGFVEMRGEKMAKSVGNIISVYEAVEMADVEPVRRAEIVRLWMLGTHYRQPVEFSRDALNDCRRILDRFYGTVERSGVRTDKPDVHLVDALSDDVNTPEALRCLHSLVTAANRGDETAAAKLKASASLLGLMGVQPEHWRTGIVHGRAVGSIVFGGKASAQAVDQKEAIIKERLAARSAARKAKRFEEADHIRAELAAEGIILEDTPTGTTWRRA
jgi:cysteinyl-tRNA synthetase